MSLDNPVLGTVDNGLQANVSLSSAQPSPVGLLWQHRVWGALSNWQVQNGQVQSIAPIALPDNDRNWQLAGNGDFNQDGTIDLLWRHQLTGQNRLSLANLSQNIGRSAAGQTVFLPSLADLQWQVATVQDFNQDGSADILWRHQETGENRLWLMQGSQVKLSIALPDQPDLAWKFGGAADFNQDGNIDLLWRNQNNGENLVWLMDGTQRWQERSIAKLDDLTWQIAGVADMNQDGQADILWRHDQGYNVAWLMRGVEQQGSMLLPVVDDPNWQVKTIVPSTLVQSSPNPWPAATSPAPIDLSVSQLSVPTIVFTPGESIAVNVQAKSNLPNLNAPIKLSFYLSSDSSISKSDMLLDAVIVDPPLVSASPNNPLTQLGTVAPIVPNSEISVSRTLQLPGMQNSFWRAWDNGNSSTNSLGSVAYIGAIVDFFDGTPELKRDNNQNGQAIELKFPNLTTYDFTYYYDITNRDTVDQTGDFYRGSVVAYEGAYKINQIVDPMADLNQSGKNGAYVITSSRAYTNPDASSREALGSVTVMEYYDAKSQTRYVPNLVTGRNYLGSESGFVRSQGSNTDRFGYDFYEADVWVVPPVAPLVGTAPRSLDWTVRSLVNPFLSYWDTKDNGGIITYSFYKDNQTPYYGAEKVSELSDRVKQNVRQILSVLESQLNLRFVEVEETATTAGVIRYLGSDGEGNPFYAYTYYPGAQIGGDVHLNANFAKDVTNGFGADAGTYGYRSLIHETLHALGLKHPGNYDAASGGGSPPFLYPEDDNSTNTVMSYNVVGFNPITAMDYDLTTLQYLYGARSLRPNNSQYQFSSLFQYKVGEELYGSALQASKQILWDAGGTQDTLDFSQLATVSNNIFDLRPGGILTRRSAYNTQYYVDSSGKNSFATSDYGVKLANATMIENIINSRGNDYIVANQVSNQFLGYRLGVAVGSDEIELANGSDVLVLENYRIQDLKVTIDRNDLVLGLAGDGTVRLLDYLSLRNAARIKIGDSYYLYSVTQGWQQTTAPTIVKSNIKLASGVVSQRSSASMPQSTGDQNPSEEAHSRRCHCPSCDDGRSMKDDRAFQVAHEDYGNVKMS